MRVLQMKKLVGCVAIAAATFGAAACGEVARTGRSPAFLVIEALEGASGADPGKFSTVVSSDVVTLVDSSVSGQTVKVPTIYADPGRVTFHATLKNLGSAALPTAATPLNDVTITRYRVAYRRADGRNTQGVDVPYTFDGGMTVTTPSGGGSVTGIFDLVRVSAKAESPLVNLQGFGGAQFIATIAEITFFGRDQAGNDVSVSGTMSVSFADYGDPSK